MLDASVIIPTKGRPGYLRATLESLAAQDLGPERYEVLVVDDARSAETRAVTEEVAQRSQARIGYVERQGTPGANSARNTGIAVAEADLIALVDDDVEAPPSWLRAMVEGRRRYPGCQAFGGPIRLRLEGSRLRMCGREAPPMTTLDGGLRDREIDAVWSANMALRRSAMDVAGEFDPGVAYGFDEVLWQQRLRAGGGRIMYLSRAGLVHRRDRRDARLRSLVWEAFCRGRRLRAYSERAGHAPSLARELRVLAGCVFHTFRYGCGNGVLLAAHSAGRVLEALRT